MSLYTYILVLSIKFLSFRPWKKIDEYKIKQKLKKKRKNEIKRKINKSTSCRGDATIR